MFILQCTRWHEQFFILSKKDQRNPGILWLKLIVYTVVSSLPFPLVTICIDSMLIKSLYRILSKFQIRICGKGISGQCVTFIQRHYQVIRPRKISVTIQVVQKCLFVIKSRLLKSTAINSIILKYFYYSNNKIVYYKYINIIMNNNKLYLVKTTRNVKFIALKYKSVSFKLRCYLTLNADVIK